jgi:hypothetical protein
VSIRLGSILVLAFVLAGGATRPARAQSGPASNPAVGPVSPNIAQFLLIPNSVVGGQTVTGQLVLSQVAGPGGVMVSLVSSNPAVVVAPASVTVPQGANGVTFTVVTLPVGEPVSVILNAFSLGGTARATLQVAPPASLSANLLMNGSFESPTGGGYGGGGYGTRNLPGWRVLRGTVDVVPDSDWTGAPGQGRQVIDLVGTPGAATIEQSFDTQPGTDYLFSGWMSHNGGVVEGRANVSLNGQFFVQLLHREPVTNPRELHWVQFSYRFRATGPTTTLRLEDVTNLWDAGGGLALDGLAVVPAEAPIPGVVPVYNPKNGHWYQAVRLTTQISWAAARSAAERALWQGLKGHLATITSAEEDQFITSAVLGPGGEDVWWLGGYQDKSAPDYQEPGGGWRWVTGEPWGYTRWHAATGEPNNLNGEDVLDRAQGWGGDWNDESSAYPLANYLVEYEPTPAPPVSQQAPAAPTNLVAEHTFATRIDLRWQDNSDNEQEFILWRRRGTEGFVRIGKVGPNVTTFADTGLQPQTTYTYAVRAWNPAGASRRSNQLTVRTLASEPLSAPQAPTGLTASATAATEIRLTWQDNSSDEAAFVLFRQGPDTRSERIASLPANSTSYLDRDVRPGTTYRYLVRAWNPTGGASSRSNEATATTPLAQ